MRQAIVCALLLLSRVVSGQHPTEKPAFEVVSIKRAQPAPMGQVRVAMNADADMLRYTNVTLKDCIRVAYGVKEFQVQGPDSLLGQRFDIVAKLPAGASQDQIPEMLQGMLSNRFKLTLHRETKEHAIYALVVAKGGPKLKAAEVQTVDAAASGAGQRAGAPPRNAMIMQVDGAGAHLKAPSATLSMLGETISRFSERPVVDMTGISGRYDFDLVFAPESVRGMPGGMRQPPGEGARPGADVPAEPAASIYDSVRVYGLRLEPRKASMDVLVVDHIESQPTEN